MQHEHITIMKIIPSSGVPVSACKRIGFAGSHRTGKSTMARVLSLNVTHKSGELYEFVPTGVSDARVWNECHMSPSEQVTFAERVILQERILDHLAGIYAKSETYSVFDRTPLDLIGYLMANVDQTCSNLFTNRVEKLIGDCIRLTMMACDKVIVIQPSFDAVEDTGKIGKTFLSRPYQMAVNNHIIATCVNYLSPDRYLIVPTNERTTDGRLSYITSQICNGHLPSIPQARK